LNMPTLKNLFQKFKKSEKLLTLPGG